MAEHRKDKTIFLKILIAGFAAGVLILSALPMAHVGPSARIPLHVAPTMADSGKTMGRELQLALSRSAMVIDRDAPAAFLLDKTAPLLSPPPLTGSRLPRPGAETDMDAAGNELFFVETKETLDLRDILDGNGQPSGESIDLLVFHHFYLAQNGEKQIAGTSVREMWSWESAPYVDHVRLAEIQDATLRNNTIAALVSRGHSLTVELSTGAAPAFYKLSTSVPWISPEPSHIPTGAHLEKVLDMNKKKDVTAVYSISPNTGGAFVHKNAVPLHATVSGDSPSGFEARMLTGEDGAKRMSLRIVTVAQGRFNGTLSHEQLLDVPLTGR